MLEFLFQKLLVWKNYTVSKLQITQCPLIILNYQEVFISVLGLELENLVIGGLSLPHFGSPL